MADEFAFWGHRADDGRVQPLIEHLRGVSDLAGEFADAFGEGGMGKLVGLYHDVGKYSMRKICNEESRDKLLSSLC